MGYAGDNILKPDDIKLAVNNLKILNNFIPLHVGESDIPKIMEQCRCGNEGMQVTGARAKSSKRVRLYETYTSDLSELEQ